MGYYKATLNSVSSLYEAGQNKLKISSFGEETRWVDINEESIDVIIEHLKQFRETIKRYVRVHDIENETHYDCKKPEDARDSTDKSGVTLALKLKDTVTTGKFVYEYLVDDYCKIK